MDDEGLTVLPDTAAPDAGPARRRAVTPRHAASLIVVRRSPHGPEMLMGMRGAKHRFMPNRLVFPGGAVDRADWRARFAAPLRPDVLMRLAKASTPRLAPALAVAAARELAEETGLSLGTPPHLDGLDYLCRAITPPEHPIRFNARFLVVDAKHVTGTLAGSGELEGLRFFGLNEALGLDLPEPQRRVIELLPAWLARSPDQRAAETHLPVFRRRAWALE